MSVEFIRTFATRELDSGCCPKCGRTMSATSCVSGEYLPQPGDSLICFYCGEILVFDAGMQARVMTRAQRRAAQRRPDWEDYLGLQRKFREATASAVFLGDGADALVLQRKERGNA